MSLFLTNLFSIGFCRKYNHGHDMKFCWLHNHNWGSSLCWGRSAPSIEEISNWEHSASITDRSYSVEGGMIAGISIFGVYWLLLCCYVVTSACRSWSWSLILLKERPPNCRNCSSLAFRTLLGEGKKDLFHLKSEFEFDSGYIDWRYWQKRKKIDNPIYYENKTCTFLAM